MKVHPRHWKRSTGIRHFGFGLSLLLAVAVSFSVTCGSALAVCQSNCCEPVVVEAATCCSAPAPAESRESAAPCTCIIEDHGGETDGPVPELARLLAMTPPVLQVLPIDNIGFGTDRQQVIAEAVPDPPWRSRSARGLFLL